jgi:hypothetical protein
LPNLRRAAAVFLERPLRCLFGIATFAAHVHGLVRAMASPMWLARRAQRRSTRDCRQPRRRRIAAGHGADDGRQGLGGGRHPGRHRGPRGMPVRSARATEGLQRETIFVLDLWLDAEFIPATGMAKRSSTGR